jgi:hypothetical protein
MLTKDQKTEIKHLAHLEDMLVSYGFEALPHIEKLVNDIYSLDGNSDNVFMQVKIDGAPSLVWGRDPRDGRFFLSTKSAFNKEPKLLKSFGDITKFSADIRPLLILAFSYLHLLHIPEGIAYQGDVIFTENLGRPDSKKFEIIDGIEYITFQPNVVKYAIESRSNYGFFKYAERASMGIVVHTKYVIDSTFYMMQIDLDFRYLKCQIKKLKGLFLIDNIVKGHRLKKLEFKNKNNALARIEEINEYIETSSGDFIAKSKLMYPKIAKRLQIFINSMLDSGIFLDAKENNLLDTEKYFNMFTNDVKWVITKYIDSLLSERGRRVKTIYREECLDYLRENRPSLEEFFELYYQLIQVKYLLLEDLLIVVKLFDKSMISDKDAHEGLVIVGEEHTIKLVDRHEFSAANRETGRFK